MTWRSGWVHASRDGENLMNRARECDCTHRNVISTIDQFVQRKVRARARHVPPPSTPDTGSGCAGAPRCPPPTQSSHSLLVNVPMLAEAQAPAISGRTSLYPLVLAESRPRALSCAGSGCAGARRFFLPSSRLAPPPSGMLASLPGGGGRVTLGRGVTPEKKNWPRGHTIRRGVTLFAAGSHS